MPKIDWKLERQGVALVPEVGYPMGLAARNFASDTKLAPRGRVVKQAIALAKDRQARYVNLELLMEAKGDVPAGTVAGDLAQPLRRSMARSRRLDRKAAAEAVAEAKREARRVRKAAKLAQ